MEQQVKAPAATYWQDTLSSHSERANDCYSPYTAGWLGHTPVPLHTLSLLSLHGIPITLPAQVEADSIRFCHANLRTTPLGRLS